MLTRIHGLIAAVLISFVGLLILGADQRTVWLACNTALLATGVCLVSLPIGSGLALLAFRTNLPMRRSLLIGWLAFLFVPLYLQAAAWDAGFGRLGWCSMASETIGVPWLRGWFAAIWIHSIHALSWVILIVGAAAVRVEPELEDDARLYGSSWWVLWRVTLRRSVAGIAIAALWIAVTTSSTMTVTDLYQIRTLAEALYTGFSLYDSTTGIPGLWPSLFAAFCLAAVIGYVSRHIATRPFDSMSDAPQRFDLGHWRWPCWVAAVGVFLLAVGVPLANLTYQAGLVVHQSGTTHVRAWSAERFVELIVPLPGRYERAAAWRFQREFGWTIILSGTTATLSLVAAVPLGWWARRGGRPGLPAALLIAMGLAVPGPLVGIAVIWLFTRGTSTWSIWLYNQTLAAPLLALMWRCLPLTILVCWFAASTIPTCREDAAAVDGIGPIGRFWFFGIGQRKLALGVAWLVAAAIAGGDLTTSILVAPPGVTTLPIRVFNLLHAGVDDEVAAICLLNIAVIAALGAVVLFLGAHWLDRMTRTQPATET